jgi:hypothetical protein
MNQIRATILIRIIIPVYISTVLACATVRTYDEALLQWKSHKDVAKWMNWFTYDFKRNEATQYEFAPPRTPQETFRLRSGVCHDAAYFIKKTLDQIDPSYKARIVWIKNSEAPNHFVCSFEEEGKLYIMDYGTAYPSMVGTWGPFNSLEAYKKFYQNRHPKPRRVEEVRFIYEYEPYRYRRWFP